MDKSIVAQGLMNAKRLMNDATFNAKVNGYVNNGAGADGYMPQNGGGYPADINESYDPMDYTQRQQTINTKLPKNILDSMLNHPIDVTMANSGMGSVLEGIDTTQLERQTPVQRPRRQLNESVPAQQPMMHPAGFDSNYLKFLVKEAVKECMEEMKTELLSESTLKGLKIGGGNKIMLIDQKGNLFEAQMTLKKKAQ